MTVMMGIKALRNMCTMTMRVRASPLARAVRMKSWFMTSSMLVLVIRAIDAAYLVPRERQGSKYAAGLSRPLMGMARKRRPIKICNTIATQKDGALIPATAKAINTRSRTLPRCRAARMPKERPMANATA